MLSNSAEAQRDSSGLFCIELHFGTQDCFGPSNKQAELSGGIDTISYDKKIHLNPGFKSGTFFELAASYRRKKTQLHGTVTYFKQDIGLIASLAQNEYSLFKVNLMSLKAGASLQLSDYEKHGAYGFYTGFFISTIFPVSYSMDQQTKKDFMIKSFAPATQFNWGIDLSYLVPIGEKGLYALMGASGTMPGFVGSIGKIKMQSTSPYSAVHSNIGMYSVKIFLGVGFHVPPLRSKKSKTTVLK